MIIGERTTARNAQSGSTRGRFTPHHESATVAPAAVIERRPCAEVVHHRTVLGFDIQNAKTRSTNLMQSRESAGQGILI
ncbi:hypothetical protein [Mycobacterium sp. SM3041]|uniref:hypothetical protein n=1 Tax=Mycobacterium sp. SM3041 TaxID=3114291 RepID=UPI000B2207E1